MREHQRESDDRRENQMEFRDILVALTTYPEPTPGSAVEDAVEIAAVMEAKISALAFAVRLHSPPNIYGKMLLDVPAMAAGEAKKSLSNAESLLAAFQNSAKMRGVLQDSIQEHCFVAEASEVLIDYARLRDLTILPLSERRSSDPGYAESIVFESGRPTIVIPNVRTSTRAFALDTVVVAWDFSRPASRAVADALSLLKKAKRVYVVTVTNEKSITSGRSGPELAKHLARHGANVVLDSVDAAGRTIGTVLESYASSQSANLLVMGAYGHSRFREFVLGGATRSMISRPRLPIFFSH
jgi:nucleotide-binding universal stress UspA family protein